MTGEADPRVAILIPTWNRRADLLRCLASLTRLDYDNFAVVVVDNASADGTASAVRERYPDCVVLENATNLGFAGGNNVGIRWALEHGSDFVLLINNDTEATPGLVRELVRVARQDERIAAVGARNLLLEDPARLWGAYGALTFGPFVVRSEGQGEPDGPRWQTVRDVDWVIGNAMMLRRAPLERLGLLDEGFFAYHEDVDWCLRARAAGYRVVYAGTAAILHQGGGTSDPGQAHSFPQWYFLGRNGVLLARRHGRGAQRLRFALSCAAAFAARLARALLLRGAPAPQARARGARFWRMELAYGRGVIDALRRRPVPFERLGLANCALHGDAGAEKQAAVC